MTKVFQNVPFLMLYPQGCWIEIKDFLFVLQAAACPAVSLHVNKLMRDSANSYVH